VPSGSVPTDGGGGSSYGCLAVVARLTKYDGSPDLALRTRILDQRGWVAESGERELRVLARVLMGVVTAHFRLCLTILPSISFSFSFPSPGVVVCIFFQES